MNIVEPILFQCKLNPWGAAICTPGSAIDTINYGQLGQAIHNVARTALKHDLRPGQTAAIFVKETIFHAALILALTRLGIVTVSGRRGKVPPELKIDAIITDEPNSFIGMGNVIGFDLSWTMGDGKPLDYDQSHQTKEDDLCRIVLTSGATGEAKAIGLSHKMLWDRIASYAYSRGSRFHQCSRLFCDLGIATTPGFQYAMYTLLRSGTIYFLSEDPTAILQYMDLHKIQNMTTSPYGLGEFVKYFERDSAYECSFDHIVCQGAMLSKELSERVRARMCQSLYSSYGSTEAGIAAFGPANVLADIPGAVGYIEPDVSIEIVDDSGQVLPVGREGMVRIHSMHLAKRYIGDPRATAKSFRDGCFYPGDFGHLTADGLLVIGGREKTVLNLGGDTIKPEIIEEALTTFGGIDEAAAFGMKDELGIAQPWALVVSRVALNEAALRAHCNAKLPSWAVPVRFVSVDAIPRTGQGKIERHRLPELAKAKMS